MIHKAQQEILIQLVKTLLQAKREKRESAREKERE